MDIFPDRMTFISNELISEITPDGFTNVICGTDVILREYEGKVWLFLALKLN